VVQFFFQCSTSTPFLCGGAHHQADGEENARRRNTVFLLDDIQGQAGDVLTEAGSILIETGERNAKKVVIVDVSAADHGDVPGYFQSGLENGAESPHSQWVVAAKHAVRPGIQLQKLLHGTVAASISRVIAASMLDDVTIGKTQTMFRECRQVTSLTINRGADLGTGDMGNRFAADINQMLGCK
jgi:hypothetical protein